MLPQGLLGFQYEADRSSGGLTSLAGLPLYLDLIGAMGLGAAIRQHVHVAGAQGWLDIQMVLALIFLNLAGGDCVEDFDVWKPTAASRRSCARSNVTCCRPPSGDC
jgi:hypothetical protein